MREMNDEIDYNIERGLPRGRWSRSGSERNAQTLDTLGFRSANTQPPTRHTYAQAAYTAHRPREWEVAEEWWGWVEAGVELDGNLTSEQQRYGALIRTLNATAAGSISRTRW